MALEIEVEQTPTMSYGAERPLLQPKITMDNYINHVEIFDLQNKYSLRPPGFFDNNICEFLLPSAPRR
jgi:hypothetical protein